MPENRRHIMTELALELKGFRGSAFLEGKIPKELEGSSYFLDSSEDGKREGPFLFHFILCTEYMVYYDDLVERNISPSDGYTNIIFPVDFAGKVITVPYQFSDATSEESYAMIWPVLHDNLLRSMDVTLFFEKDFDRAVRAASYCVSSILDSLSFRLRIPLAIRDIVISSFNTGQMIGRFITIPYFPITLERKEDFYVARDIPSELRPYLRIFREALNSTNSHYRLLCLYRITERLKILQNHNSIKLKQRGVHIDRSSLIVPENHLTKTWFPMYSGKKIGSFLKHVENTYRNHIAHLNIEELDNIVLDPMSVKTDHNLEYTNMVLMQIVQQMIENEWMFMKDNNL